MGALDRDYGPQVNPARGFTGTQPHLVLLPWPAAEELGRRLCGRGPDPLVLYGVCCLPPWTGQDPPTVQPSTSELSPSCSAARLCVDSGPSLDLVKCPLGNKGLESVSLLRVPHPGHSPGEEGPGHREYQGRWKGRSALPHGVPPSGDLVNQQIQTPGGPRLAPLPWGLRQQLGTLGRGLQSPSLTQPAPPPGRPRQQASLATSMPSVFPSTSNCLPTCLAPETAAGVAPAPWSKPEGGHTDRAPWDGGHLTSHMPMHLRCHHLPSELVSGDKESWGCPGRAGRDTLAPTSHHRGALGPETSFNASCSYG